MAEKSDIQPVRSKLIDVARVAGVHSSTVSRALNAGKDYRIPSETVERIRKVAADLGYRADPAAASLRTNRSHAIGVLVPRLSDPVIATIYESIESTAMEHGFLAMATSTQENPKVRRTKVEAYRKHRVDALIVADVRRDATDYQRLTESGIPFVLVNRRNRRSPAVTTDDFLGGYLAGRHLVELGHVSAMIFSGPTSTSTGWERAAGCRKAFKEAGIDIPNHRVIRTPLTAKGGATAMRQVLESSVTRPTAIFASDDHVAIGAMGEARKAGYVAGEHFALVGFNDVSVASSMSSPLTTLHTQLAEMGRLAVLSTLGMLDGGSALDLRIPPKLIVRDTSVLNHSAG